MSALTHMLIRHEGMKLLPYRDAVGKLTIGVGHNLDDNGITGDVAAYILDRDIDTITSELRSTFPWFNALDPVRQDAVVDMAFNLGLPRFKKFEHMIAALAANDYDTAANEMLASNWSKEVGARATELAQMIKSGQYQV